MPPRGERRRPSPGERDEAALRAAWKRLDSVTRRTIWRSVARGEAVGDKRRRPHAVWLARRLRRGLPLQALTGLLAGVLLASILNREGYGDFFVALALGAGLAQLPLAVWRYRRAQRAEQANLPGS